MSVLTIPAGLAPLCVAPGATLRQAMEAIDHGGSTVCLVVSPDGRLEGLLTDGDLRRRVLAGHRLDDPVDAWVNRDPLTVAPGTARAHVLDIMRARKVHHVPVVEDGRLCGLHTLGEVVGRRQLPNHAVIMAGGRGTRLGDLTRNVPKPLMKVAGRSILEWTILELVGAGIRHVWLSVGHFADQIVEAIGDGHDLGCHVEYLFDSPGVALGTAGALPLLAQRCAPAEPVLVMNGDLVVRFQADDLLDHHVRAGSAVTVAVRQYAHQVPFGVVEVDQGGRVRRLSEKPVLDVPVAAGIYVLSPEVLRTLTPGRPVNMPDIINAALAAGEAVGTWAVENDWIDVGTPTDLARARGAS